MKWGSESKSRTTRLAALAVAAAIMLPLAGANAQPKTAEGRDQKALRDEIAKLRAQVERLQATVEKCQTVGCPAAAPASGTSKPAKPGAAMSGGTMNEHPMGGMGAGGDQQVQGGSMPGMQGGGMQNGGMGGSGMGHEMMEHQMGGMASPTAMPQTPPPADKGQSGMGNHMDEMHRHMDQMHGGGGMGAPSAPSAPTAPPNNPSGSMPGGMNDM